MTLPYEKLLTPKLISHLRQNKPSLIARDLSLFGIPMSIVHDVLLARGVYKWFSVRRMLIRLKDEWKGRVRLALSMIATYKKSKNHYELAWWRGYLRAYEQCRAEVRCLCHSPRWQAPDFDRHAKGHLYAFELCEALHNDQSESATASTAIATEKAG